jgi:hypothetical protein
MFIIFKKDLLARYAATYLNSQLTHFNTSLKLGYCRSDHQKPEHQITSSKCMILAFQISYPNITLSKNI